jgi:N-acetylmuramoyl-L-alanine amidase
VSLIARQVWQDPAKPVTGPIAYQPSIERIVLHYPGADWSDMDFDNDGDVDPADTVTILRQMQASYLSSRGYSLGYNFAVDTLGSEYEVRGLAIRNAANREVNNTTVSVLAIVDAEAPAALAQRCAIQRSVRRIRVRLGKHLTIVGHRDVGATACPGGGLYAQMQSGAFEPVTSWPFLRSGMRSSEVAYAREILRTSGAIKGNPSDVYDPAMAKAVSDLKKFLGYKVTSGTLVGPRFWKFLDALAVS